MIASQLFGENWKSKMDLFLLFIMACSFVKVLQAIEIIEKIS